MTRAVLAVILGSRATFPAALVAEGRGLILDQLRALDVEAVVLEEPTTRMGAVGGYRDALACADLFRRNADRIDGILVTLPNFGDETSVAEAIRQSGLRVPILVHAFPDDLEQLTLARRRDAFCGKISVCNNLHQYGYPFSLTSLHTVRPDSGSFATDLVRFVAVCRVVKGLRGARLGMVGTRPDAFKTVRFSERLLEMAGISVSVIDLSDVRGLMDGLPSDDPRLAAKSEQFHAYADLGRLPAASVERMVRFSTVLDRWIDENGLQGTAIQCWTSLQTTFGFSPCGVMSMMSDRLLPSACEADVPGLLSMYALQLASGQPSVIADWNNNYGDNPDKAVFWHCGNWPRSYMPDTAIDQHPILAPNFGADNTWGAVHGRASEGPMTFLRLTTDDRHGCIRGIVGEGAITADQLETWGTRAVVEIPGLQGLLAYICREGFEHHVAMTNACVAAPVGEALETYLGWDVHWHPGGEAMADRTHTRYSPAPVG